MDLTEYDLYSVIWGFSKSLAPDRCAAPAILCRLQALCVWLAYFGDTEEIRVLKVQEKVLSNFEKK